MDSQELADLQHQLQRARQELSQANQVNQVLTQSNQVLTQSNQVLTQSNQELSQSNQELSHELERVLRENNSLKRASLLASITSFSHKHAYGNFSELASSDGKINFQRAPDGEFFDLAVKGIWQKLMSELDPPDTGDEKSIQSWFDKEMPQILLSLGNKGIQYVSRPTMTAPAKVPDAVLVPLHTPASKWTNVILPFEFEKIGTDKANEGRGQAISYASIVVKAQEVQKRDMILCVFSNWETIAFLQIDQINDLDESKVFHQTALLPLFPSQSAGSSSGSSSAAPTTGFKKLCQVLASDQSVLGFRGIPKYIRVDSEDWKVEDELGHGTDSIVYKCTRNGEAVAVKVPRTPSSSSFHDLQLEAGWIQAIRKALSERGKSQLLPEVVSYCFNALVLKPVEQTLSELLYGASQEVCKEWLARWLKSLNDLHKSGYCHNDMSPANILANVATGNLLFIDWQSAAEIGSTLCTLRSSIPQIPSRWIPFVVGEDCSQLQASARDDIEQWIYAVSYFLHDQKFPWMSSLKTRTITTRFENEIYISVQQDRHIYYVQEASYLEMSLYKALHSHTDNTVSASEYNEYLDLILANE